MTTRTSTYTSGFTASDYNNKENLSNILKYYWDIDNVDEPLIYAKNDEEYGKRRDLRTRDRIEVYEASFPMEVSDIGHNTRNSSPRYTLDIMTAQSETRLWGLVGEVQRIFGLSAVRTHPTDSDGTALPFQYVKVVGRRDLSNTYVKGYMVAYDVVLEYVHRSVAS